MKCGCLIGLCALAVVSLGVEAQSRVEFFDPKVLPEAARQDIGRLQLLSCAAVNDTQLPLTMSSDARLLWLACNGHQATTCGRGQPQLRASEMQLACADGFAPEQIQALAAVTPESLAETSERLEAYFDTSAEVKRLGDAVGGTITLLVTTAANTAPRHLRITLSRAGSAFGALGFATMLRLVRETPDYANARRLMCLTRRTLLDSDLRKRARTTRAPVASARFFGADAYRCYGVPAR